MGAAYNILGKMVPPHFLAIGTIGAVVGGITASSYLGKTEEADTAPAAPAAPATEAGELDVEKAINDFLASNDKKEA